MKNHHDRLNVQKQLVGSESRLKTIFNDSPISMILHDCETGEIVGANNAALALFQADSLTQLNEALWYDDSPYSAEDALRYIHDALQEDQNFIWRSKTKSGNYLYERVLLRPIMINDVKRILSASIDITESKYQEEKNRDLENQLQLLVAEMPVGLVLFEAVYDELNIPIDFTYLNVNQSFEDFSELKAKDIIGNNF
jgi:PAS domain S-box-containing protein